MLLTSDSLPTHLEEGCKMNPVTPRGMLCLLCTLRSSNCYCCRRTARAVEPAIPSGAPRKPLRRKSTLPDEPTSPSIRQRDQWLARVSQPSDPCMRPIQARPCKSWKPSQVARPERARSLETSAVKMYSSAAELSQQPPGMTGVGSPPLGGRTTGLPRRPKSLP